MDISQTTAPNSSQQNYDDYLSGPKVVTVAGVSRGNAEQPVNIELVEFPGRPYKPSKSMRRVLVAAWGPDSSAYVGRRLKLVGNPDIKFGGHAVGGIEIAALSHIDKPVVLALTVTRGKKRRFTVEPLREAPTQSAPAPTVTVADVEACTDVDQLRAWWQNATDDVKQAITARANHLADLHAATAQDGELVQGELIEEDQA